MDTTQLISSTWKLVKKLVSWLSNIVVSSAALVDFSKVLIFWIKNDVLRENDFSRKTEISTWTLAEQSHDTIFVFVAKYPAYLTLGPKKKKKNTQEKSIECPGQLIFIPLSTIFHQTSTFSAPLRLQRWSKQYNDETRKKRSLKSPTCLAIDNYIHTRTYIHVCVLTLIYRSLTLIIGAVLISLKHVFESSCKKINLFEYR